jgi:hypothetical protein
MTIPNTSTQPRSRWQVATMATIGFAIVWNFITNSFPPTGVTIAQLSNTVFANVRIIPANYAFAVWGVIYVGLTAFGIYQLDPRRADNIQLQQTRPWIIIASLLQCAWILLFLYQQMLLSSLVMLGIVWALTKCYLSLHTTDKSVRQSDPAWVPHVFSIYLGWITVATIVNISSTLDLWGWHGRPLSPEFWTVLMMVLSVGLAVLLRRIYADRVFIGTIIWAIGGIIIANLTSPIIAIGGLVSIAILTLSMFWRSQAL